MTFRLFLLALFATLAASSGEAQAGGVITHGRDRPNLIVDGACDAECQELHSWVMELYDSRDAMIAQRADALGFEVLTLEMLDQPEVFGVAPQAEAQGGCAASGGSLFAGLVGLFLLRRRRRGAGG